MKKTLLIITTLMLGGGMLYSQAYRDTVAFGALNKEANLKTVPEFPFMFVNGSEFPVAHDFTFTAGESNSTTNVDVDVKISFSGSKTDPETGEMIDSTVYLNWRDNKYVSISPWPSEDSPGRSNGDYRQMNEDEVFTLVFDSVKNTPPNELYPPVQMSLAGIGAWCNSAQYVDLYLNGEMVGVWIPDPSTVRTVTPILTDIITKEPVYLVIKEGDTLQMWGLQNPRTYYRLVGFMMVMENTEAATSLILAAEGGTAEITDLNGALRILGTVTPANASDQRIIWSVDDKGTGATINSGGVLQALPRSSGNGTVTVTGTMASDASVKSSIDVIISGQIDVPVDSIFVRSAGSSDSIVINGGTLQMIAEAYPEYAADKDVTWSVEDNGTGATIDSEGLLTAAANNNGNGTVRVKATAKDGSGVFDTLDIVIINQEAAFVELINITYDGEFPEITENKGTLQLHVEVIPASASDKTVTWSVKDNGTGASIDQMGLLTAAGGAQGNGTVKVLATANDGSGVADSVEVMIVGQVVSVNDIMEANAISVYPNPLNEGQTLFVRVSDDAFSIESISIYQYTGQRTARYTGFAEGTNQAEISINGAAGIYLLKVNTNNGCVVHRIVKTR